MVCRPQPRNEPPKGPDGVSCDLALRVPRGVCDHMWVDNLHDSSTIMGKYLLGSGPDDFTIASIALVVPCRFVTPLAVTHDLS